LRQLTSDKQKVVKSTAGFGREKIDRGTLCRRKFRTGGGFKQTWIGLREEKKRDEEVTIGETRTVKEGGVQVVTSAADYYQEEKIFGESTKKYF